MASDSEKSKISITRKIAQLEELLKLTTPENLKTKLKLLKLTKLRLLLEKNQNLHDLGTLSKEKLQALEMHFTVESKKEQTQNKTRLLSILIPGTTSEALGQLAKELQLPWSQQASPISTEEHYSDVNVSPTYHLPSGHQALDLTPAANMLLP